MFTSILDITDFPVLSCNFRNFSLFTATCKNSPSARRVAAANHFCEDDGVLRKGISYLEQILH
jgi:hypothetical protein